MLDATSPYRAASPAATQLAPSLGWTRPATLLLTLVGAVLPTLIAYSLSLPGGCSVHPEPPHPEGIPLVVVVSGVPLWLGAHVQKKLADSLASARVASRFQGFLLGLVTFVPVGLCVGFAVLASFLVLVHYEGLVRC